jgi:hypothetical protein
MSKETYKEAIELFGKTIVNEVISLAYISDADCIHSFYMDMDKHDHAECVEFIFFN